jgi:hypothetical protein
VFVHVFSLMMIELHEVDPASRIEQYFNGKQQTNKKGENRRVRESWSSAPDDKNTNTQKAVKDI